MMAAIPSLSGIANHTPSNPMKRGRMAIKGTRNISWRDMLRNMLTFVLPILWKKLVITICAPMMMNRAMIYRIATTE